MWMLKDAFDDVLKKLTQVDVYPKTVSSWCVSKVWTRVDLYQKYGLRLMCIKSAWILIGEDTFKEWIIELFKKKTLI